MKRVQRSPHSRKTRREVTSYQGNMKKRGHLIAGKQEEERSPHSRETTIREVTPHQGNNKKRGHLIAGKHEEERSPHSRET
jgi:hypothetical protein